MVCSCVVPSKFVLLQIIFCSCVIGTTLSRENGRSLPWAARKWLKYENKLGDRMIKQLNGLVQDGRKWLFWVICFPSKVPEVLACAFRFSKKEHSLVSFFGWNALVPLCCVHCACFDILTSFFSEAKSKPAKKIQGNILLLNWKAHAKIQALLTEKNVSRKSHQAIQLLNLVIAKSRDLSVSRRSIVCLSLRLRQVIDLFASDKPRYFAQPRPIIVNYFNITTSFQACSSGKLYPWCTSLKVIVPVPENILETKWMQN